MDLKKLQKLCVRARGESSTIDYAFVQEMRAALPELVQAVEERLLLSRALLDSVDYRSAIALHPELLIAARVVQEEDQPTPTP